MTFPIFVLYVASGFIQAPALAYVNTDNPPRREGGRMSYLERLKQGHAFSIEEVLANKEAIAAEGFWTDRIFLLPADLKGRIGILAQLVVVAISNLEEIRTSRTDYSMDDALKLRLKRLSQALAYLTNSASFRDNKLYPFDKVELESRLKP